MMDMDVSVDDLQKQVNRLEQKAFNGEPLPDGLSSAEQKLFLRFRYLYEYAKLVQMPKDQGRREKELILAEYISDIVNDVFYAHIKQLWENAEAASAAVRKDPELSRNPLVVSLLEAIYGPVKSKGESHGEGTV